MEQSSDQSAQITTLRRYAEGLLGTRQAIELAGLDDYADLVIALAKNDLKLPKPSNTPHYLDQLGGHLYGRKLAGSGSDWKERRNIPMPCH